MLQLLCVALLTLTGLSYLQASKGFLAPAVLFCGGFGLCSLVASLFASSWGFSLGERTFFVLLIGNVLFSATAAAVHIVFSRRSARSFSSCCLLPSDARVLLVFLMVELLVLGWTLSYLMEQFPNLGLTDAMGRMKAEGRMLPAPLRQIREIVISWGYIVGYLLAQDLVMKRRQNAPLLFLVNALMVLLHLSLGNRGTAVTFFIVIGTAFLLLKRKQDQNSGGKRKGGVEKFFACLIVGFLAIVAFRYSALGRNDAFSFAEYISIYCGAEILNLDVYLNSMGEYGTTPFGRETFATSYDYFMPKIMGDEWGPREYPYLTYNEFWTGNVYTVFRPLIQDFGIAGSFIMVVLMALFSQILYEKAVGSSGRLLTPFLLLVYGFAAMGLVTCFFSGKFFDEFFTFGVMRQFAVIAVTLMVVKFAGGGLRLSRLNIRESS